MARASDDWLAVNLPRPSDLDMVEAWLGEDVGPDVWGAVLTAARTRPADVLLEQARLLGLPVARVGERRAGREVAPVHRLGAVDPLLALRPATGLQVLDMSSLWAGPLCGSILAAAGARVTRLESKGRPDPVQITTPILFRQLNGLKSDVELDLQTSQGVAELADRMMAADVVITSARPRAFEQFGLSPTTVFAANAPLIWVAITGHGWFGEAGLRVGFGDDAAVAGGLVRTTREGEPHFLGDALADPLTGLSAAVATLETLRAGGGALIDAAMSGVAASAAAELSAQVS